MQKLARLAQQRDLDLDAVNCHRALRVCLVIRSVISMLARALRVMLRVAAHFEITGHRESRRSTSCPAPIEGGRAHPFMQAVSASCCRVQWQASGKCCQGGRTQRHAAVAGHLIHSATMTIEDDVYCYWIEANIRGKMEISRLTSQLWCRVSLSSLAEQSCATGSP